MFQIEFNSTWIWEQLYCVGDGDHRSGKGEREACGGCGRSNYGEKPHTHKVWTSREISSAFGPIGTRREKSWSRNPSAPTWEILIDAVWGRNLAWAKINWVNFNLLWLEEMWHILWCKRKHFDQMFLQMNVLVLRRDLNKISLRPRETISKLSELWI